MPKHLFSQVDVFCGAPWGGNPLAVVHDAVDDQGEQLDTDLMQAADLLAFLSGLK